MSDIRTKREQQIINHDRSLVVTNLESLPAGLGCGFLEVLKHSPGNYIAKQWRRKIDGLPGIFIKF